MWTILCLIVVQLARIYGDDLMHKACDSMEPGSNTCYSLYSGTDPVTWDSARQRCMERDSDLVTLPDTKSRALAQRTVMSAALGAHDYVWVSGRRSNDLTWRYLHSTSFTGTLTGEMPTTRYCGKFAFGLNRAESDSCTRQENHYALCQYQPSTGACRAADMLLHASCFHLGTTPMTWFGARNYCRDYAQDGDLSTMILGSEQEFKDVVMDTSRGRARGHTMYFWLALARLNWQWVNTDGSAPIEHYGFSAEEGSDRGTRGSCLSTHLTNSDLRWVDKSCIDVSRYYICTTVSEIGTSTGQAMDPFTEVITSSSLNEASQSETKSVSITTMYIIIAVCVAVVLGSAAIVIILWIKKKRSPKSQPSSKFAHLSSRNITKNDITIVHELPNDFPQIAGYCTTPEAELDYSTVAEHPEPGRQLGLTMDDAYSEIPCVVSQVNVDPEGSPPYSEPGDALAEDNVHSSNEYSNLPDIRLSCYQEVDENHFRSELGDVYAMPRKSVTSLNNVVIDNPAYISNIGPSSDYSVC